MKTTRFFLILSILLALASCGAKKSMVNDNGSVIDKPSNGPATMEARKLAFVQKVSDQKVYAKNIVADMTFTAQTGDKDITVPGAIRMRKDEVIRLQLFIPLLGSEVGRLEFTPDYVLVIDRLHKQYVKADYNQLDFLKENGLNFYSLQALFWNQLLLPGASRIGEADLHRFDAKIDGMGKNVDVSLRNGKMGYVWQADRDNGQIQDALVTYDNDGRDKSELTWKYSRFKPLGSKAFPTFQEFSFSTTATNKIKTTIIRIDMGTLGTNDKWNARTAVSPSYKQMDARDFLAKLLDLQ